MLSTPAGAEERHILPSVPHWVQQWNTRTGLGTKNETMQMHDGQVQDREFGGEQGKMGIITHYLDLGLNHWWLSTKPNDDNPARTFHDAMSIIFFNKYDVTLTT